MPGFAETEGLLFPELAASADAAAAITIASGTERFTLARTDGRWGLQGRGGYPVDEGAVQALIAELAGMQALYTADGMPEAFHERNLEDPGEEGSVSVLVTVTDDAGTELANAIIGNTVSTPGGTQLASVFVRRPGESRIWLADSSLQVQTEPLAWINRDLLNLSRERVYQVAIAGDDSAPLIIGREHPNAEFTADTMPDNEVDGPWVLQAVASALERLAFEDVRPDAGLGGFEAEGEPDAVFRTFDGLAIVLDLVDADEATWVMLRAETMAPLDDVPEASLPAAADHRRLQSPEEVAAEAQALNEKVAGWAYRFPDHVTDRLRLPIGIGD